MEKEINFADIVKTLLGDEKFLKFLEKVARENNEKVVGIDSFFKDIFNKHCFILLTIGMSKKVDIESYKLETETIEIKTNQFDSKYIEYIDLIEDKKFEWIKESI